MEKILEFLKNPKKRAIIGAIIFVIIAAVCIAAPAMRNSRHTADAKEILGDKYGKVTVMWKSEAPWFEITDAGKLYFRFTKYEGDGIVEIPYLFDGVVVTSIADDGFVGAREIKGVIIPESVTNIGGWAFDDCTSLETVQFSQGLKTIGNWAFANCPKLKNVELPQSLEAIGRYAFQNCTSLDRIVLDKNVSIVKNGAFAGCTALSAIEVSAENRKFVSLGGILYDYKMQTLYAYPCGKEGAFQLSEGVTAIAPDAFRGTKLSEITLGDNITTIGEYAFADCKNLKRVRIGQSVSMLPTGAFSGCESLEKIYVPEKVSTLGMNAFYKCNALVSFTYGGSAEKWDAAQKLSGNTVLDSINIIFEK